MTRLKLTVMHAVAGLAVLVASVPVTTDSASASASRSSAFIVYHDKDNRAYVIGNNNLTDYKAYIDGMSGLQFIGNDTVILPFNNGSRY